MVLILTMPEQVKEIKESPEQQCIFCKIIKGEVPSKSVYDDENVKVILDINPANLGHLLVLPRKHYSIMPQIPGKELGQLFKIAKHMSNSILKAFDVKGTTIFVANGAAAGQKAPHFMIHVIPRKENDSLFEIPKRAVNESDLDKIKDIIVVKLKEKLGREPILVEKVKEEQKKQSEIEKENIQKETKKNDEGKEKMNGLKKNSKTIKKEQLGNSQGSKTNKSRITNKEKRDQDKRKINLDKLTDMFLKK